MKATADKIRGIDSIRFLCALWVVFGHLGEYGVIAPRQGFSIWNAARAAHGAIFNGPAAVIVFFIISGFCIHYPHRKQSAVRIPEFYCRRYLRIGVPMLAAIAMAAWLGVQALLIHRSSLVVSLAGVRGVQDSDIGVIWSLVCEIIYYTLYPLLLVFIRRFGWPKMMGLAYGIAILVLAMRPTALSYPAYGNLLTWGLGLPCWLLGALLAESVDSAGPVPVPRWEVWGLRLTVWFLSSVALLLRFHAGVGYPWTLTLFGIFCFYWLKREIMYFRRREPVRLLEWGGTWSYSIYLGHDLSLPFFAVCGLVIPPGAMAHFLPWCGRTALVLAFCLAFFLLFEYPSHVLARVAGRKIAKARS